MRTETIEKTIYTYDELSESAKQRVQEDNVRFGWESGYAQELVQEMAQGIFEDAGMSGPEGLSYQLYTQGGAPVFETSGEWTDSSGVEHYLTVHAEYGSRGIVTLHDPETHEEREDTTRELQDEALSFIRQLAYKLEQDIYALDEEFGSDDYARDRAEGNGYEYDEEGNLA